MKSIDTNKQAAQWDNLWGVMWLSDGVLDLRLKGWWFETHWRHSIVSVSKISYWFNPGRQEHLDKLTWLKNCWLGGKASTQQQWDNQSLPLKIIPYVSTFEDYNDNLCKIWLYSFTFCEEVRRSRTRAHVLLNLLNEMGKSDKMRGLSSILSLFCNKFNKFSNTGAWILDSIYHMTD